jgi:hypothetical protein
MGKDRRRTLARVGNRMSRRCVRHVRRHGKIQEDAEEDEKNSRPPVTVNVLLNDGARVAVLESACYSIWVDKKAFGKREGMNMAEVGAPGLQMGAHCKWRAGEGYILEYRGGCSGG